MFIISKKIQRLLAEALKEIKVNRSSAEVHVEHPADLQHGDYASNIALQLAKELKKNPMEIAQDIVANLSSDQSIGKVEVVNPGFINFHLSREFLNSEIKRILSKKNNYGKPGKESGRKISLEHTQINPNKEPHVGHLRNACVGDAVAKILTYGGDDLKVQYYQNDVGVQIASIVLAYRREFIKRESFDSFIKWASAAYSDIEERIKTDEELAQEKSEIQISIAGQDTPEAALAQEITDKILYETFAILQKLDIAYDLIVRESDILKNKLWEKTFKALQEKESFYQAESGQKKGCWLVKLPGQEDKVIVRSNGVPTYAGNDIAYHLWKFGKIDDFKYLKLDWDTQEKPLYMTSVGQGEQRDEFATAEAIVNIIDTTQTYPQQSVIEALRVLGYTKEAENYHHVNYGFVYLSARTAKKIGIDNPEGKKQIKISGRKGSVVTLIDFMDRIEQALTSEYGKFAALKEVRNAAVKFEMLKYDTYQDIVFDLEQAIDMRGFSGPYLMYTHARIHGVLRKAGLDLAAVKLSHKHEFSESGQNVQRLLYRFPEVVMRASNEFAPHYLCQYLYDVARSYNSFYDAEKIIGTDEESAKVALSAATARVLNNGLALLGITAVKEM